VLGFYNTLTALMEQFQPDYLFVASDHPSPTFRHELFPDYKQHRPPMPEELRGQIELIEEVIASFSVPMIKFPGYEADDIMGTLANYAPAGTHCYIVTTDRDALQLVSDEITVVAPNSRANKMYTPEIVQYELGVSPALVPHYKALVGDTSDNIPGIPLVGPKTAVKWLNMFGSLDDLLQNADLLPGKAGQNLAANRDKARLYLELTTIDRNVPTYCCWHAGRLAFAEQEVRRTLESLGIRASIPTLA